MFREFFVSAYLLIFKIVFNFFKLFPQKKKTVCVASFGDNIFYSTVALRRISDEEIVILKDPRCNYPFDSSITQIIPFTILHPVNHVISIYHLATASSILFDNYFGFLGVTKFKENTTCIQLWHAAGAIKHFGLMDPSIEARSQKAKARFQQVYNRFQHVAVSSDNMATIFKESFGLNEEAIIKTGIPRTDIFYSADEKQEIIDKFKEIYPFISNKKVILYAPTYRDHQLNNYQLVLKVDKLYEELGDEYVLFIKQHPAVSYDFIDGYNDFIYDLSGYYDTNHLLLFTDLLITDYSSIPFEYALLGKPMIFYAYDMEDYENTRGLIDNYQFQVPGPVVFTTEGIVKAIQEDNFDLEKIKDFASNWHEYSNGDSSMQIALFLTGNEKYLSLKSY